MRIFRSPAVYKYLELIKEETPYAKRMTRLRNRIFGDVVRPTPKTSMRVVQRLSAEPIDKQDWVVNYYPRHVETHSLMMALRNYGLFRDEHQDFKEEIERMRALRGKTKGTRRPGDKKKED